MTLCAHRTEGEGRARSFPTPAHRARNTRGFALVLVLSLLSILVVVIYAISLIGRVDGEIGATDAYHLQARQNALLGMRIALAELQRAAGDSAAVTAPASIGRRSNNTPAYSQLLGVWAAGNSASTPTNWFVSGNFESVGASKITPDALPAPAASVITLVGRGTVLAERDMARAPRVPVGDTHGGYAFWIGDQGAKAELAVTAAEAPLAPSGRRLLADPSRDITAFADSSPQRGQPLVWDDLKYLVGGTNMKSRFRSYSTQTYWVEGAALQAGLFNVNTSDPISWEAILRAYDHARDASLPALGATDARLLAERITANIGPRESSAKPRFGPFFSIADFWDSGLVQESLVAAGITTVTADELRSVLWPMLRIRSDTFLIRAYGDARHPAETASSGASAAAVAYCEVLVQRTPQPDPLGNGLRFTPLYFRWLLPEEI